MARLFWVILLIAGVFWLVRRLAAPRREPRTTDQSFEPTVRCERCGAYVARKDAIIRRDGTYCRIHLDAPDS